MVTGIIFSDGKAVFAEGHGQVLLVLCLTGKYMHF